MSEYAFGKKPFLDRPASLVWTFGDSEEVAHA